MALSNDKLAAIRAKIQSDSSLTALDDDYPALLSALSAPTTIPNPVTVAPQIPDYPNLDQLTFLTSFTERAAIDAIESFDDWAIARLVNPAVSDEIKSFLWSIAMTAPENWEGSAFDLIEYALTNLTTSLPKINGQLIFPDPLPSPPIPRTLLNIIGTVFVDQGVISQSSFDAIGARLLQVKTDPEWTATINGPSWLEDNGIVFADEADIQQALEAG